jgi:uncharacterized protein (DUF2062 family)
MNFSEIMTIPPIVVVENGYDVGVWIEDETGESAETQALVAAVHTQEIKDAYAAHTAKQ